MPHPGHFHLWPAARPTHVPALVAATADRAAQADVSLSPAVLLPAAMRNVFRPPVRAFLFGVPLAARLNPRHQDAIRQKIQADRIIAWLQAGIFGTKFQSKPVELTPDKVSAAKALLNKSLPDLTKAEIGGEGGGPIKARVTVEFVGKAP